MWMTRAALALFTSVLVGGCGGHFPVSFERLFPKSGTPPRSEVHNQQHLQRQLETLLAADRHLEALELIGSEIARGQAEGQFSQRYPEALNGVLQEALRLQQSDQAHAAGMLYRAAHSNYPRSLALRDQTEMTLTEIDASIELCANALLEEGLHSYRRGELEKAIACWETIPDFHPEHVASQRAIATTRTQLANLRRLEQQ